MSPNLPLESAVHSRHPEGDADETLVARAKANDIEALGELFVRHSATLRRLLLSVVGPTPDLDDLVQEVFLNVHKSLSGYRGAARFSTWLHRVAVNTALGHLRRPRRTVPIEREALEAKPSPTCDLHSLTVGREMVRRLYAILDTMSPKRRTALTLFKIHGVPQKEMCKLLGVPLAVVKSRIFFAKRELEKKAGADPYLAPLLSELSI
jgi:RNA polymerase sigma-70 factor (ECF subfamily)